MKSKLGNIILTVFLYLLLAGILFILLAFLGIIILFTPIEKLEVSIYLIIWGIGLIIPVMFYKKLKRSWMIPLCMIIATIVTTMANYGVMCIKGQYLSVYTREKWDKYHYDRHCMLDSLNEQYEFIGMTEQEVIDVLGEPYSFIDRDDRLCFKYTIGHTYAEHRFYNFIFEDGVVVDIVYSQK